MANAWFTFIFGLIFHFASHYDTNLRQQKIIWYVISINIDLYQMISNDFYGLTVQANFEFQKMKIPYTNLHPKLYQTFLC